MMKKVCINFKKWKWKWWVYANFEIAGGGVWAAFPVLFSISYLHGIFHSIITFILSVATVYTFNSASFACAGTPPCVVWGSYPAVRKGALENYTFCQLCSKPKSPRSHHCRSCGICILDMDHHCPFVSVDIFFSMQKYVIIGNCFTEYCAVYCKCISC